MQINQRQRDGVTILDIKGEITIGIGGVVLRTAVQRSLSSGATKILLNLRDATAVDSSGVGELVSSYVQTINRGGKLKMVALPPKISDALHTTQLIAVLEIFDSEDEAVKSFA
jgi:anti-sigma B factor antagonist